MIGFAHRNFLQGGKDVRVLSQKTQAKSRGVSRQRRPYHEAVQRSVQRRSAADKNGRNSALGHCRWLTSRHFSHNRLAAFLVGHPLGGAKCNGAPPVNSMFSALLFSSPDFSATRCVSTSKKTSSNGGRFRPPSSRWQLSFLPSVFYGTCYVSSVPRRKARTVKSGFFIGSVRFRLQFSSFKFLLELHPRFRDFSFFNSGDSRELFFAIPYPSNALLLCSDGTPRFVFPLLSRRTDCIAVSCYSLLPTAHIKNSLLG